VQFPANIQVCIWCINHYMFVRIYNDVTVHGTIKSNSKNTGFNTVLELTSRLRCNAHQIPKLMPGLIWKHEHRGACPQGQARPRTRGARQPWQKLMKPSDVSSTAHRRICHCRNALSVTSRAELQSEGKEQNNKLNSFVSCKLFSLCLCPDLP